jgi:hypothetical protein
VGYLLGRRFGPRIFNRRDSRWLSSDHIARAQTFFEKHGPKAVVLARFVPLVRTFTPAVAGVGVMPRRRFTAYNVAGALVWSVGMLLAGFFLGGVPFVAAHIELIAVGVVAASLVPVTVTFLRRRLGHRRLSTSTARANAPSRARPSSGARTWLGRIAAAVRTAPIAITTATAHAIFQSSPMTKSYQNRPKARRNRISATSC